MGSKIDTSGPQIAVEDALDDNEPLIESEPININHPAVDRPVSLPDSERRHSEAIHTPQRLSKSSSSDVELGDMHHDDPLYSKGTPDLHKRSPWTAALNGSTFAGEAHDDHQLLNDVFDRERLAHRLGNKHFMQKLAINGTLIALWYSLSIAMSVYNKWMFSPGNLDFHFPLFSTSVHMIVQFLLASTVLWIFPQFRPSRGKISDQHGDPEEAHKARSDGQDPSKPIMTPWFYLTRIVSCGSVTGLDIGLGNTSLKFISLTFFTMVKSSTLGFVLAFAILFRLESPSWKIGAIIAVMTVGVILMVSGETAFDAVGFALLLSASFFAGLRWSLTQILLRRTAATSNPFSTLFFLTPVMFAVLFAIAIPSETFPALFDGLDILAQQQGLALGLVIVIFPGCIAFCMTAAEFALLKRTSVVTLSVCGIFKEVLTITAAGIIFGDELTPINISGLVITLAAIAVYNYTRMRRMKKHEISKARDDGAAHAPKPGVPVDAAAAAAATNKLPPESQPLRASQEPLRQSQDPFTIDDEDNADHDTGHRPATAGGEDHDEEYTPMIRSAAKPHVGRADEDQVEIDPNDIFDGPATSPHHPSPISASILRRKDGYEPL